LFTDGGVIGLGVLERVVLSSFDAFIGFGERPRVGLFFKVVPENWTGV
jgi:hypothetical protein